MIKSVREIVETNQTYQRAIEIAPEQNRRQIGKINDSIIKSFDDLADNIQKISNNPVLRQNLLNELRKRQG